MSSTSPLSLAPLLAVLFLHLGSCAGLRKVPFVDHNLPGEMEATEVRPGVYDLGYRLSKKSTPYEFRRYVAHHVSHLCLDKGFKYFLVLEASPSLRESSSGPAGEGRKNREAKGRVQFLRELPEDKSKAVFDAEDMHDNFKAFDSAGDA